MSDNKYTIEEMIEALSKMQQEKKPYPHNITRLIRERDELATRLEDARRDSSRNYSSYLTKFEECEKLREERDALVEENKRLIEQLKRIVKAVDEW